jgi:hypothetical protein
MILLHETMRYKSFWLRFFLLFFQPGHVAEISRREADLFFEQRTERTYAFKTHFIANIGDRFIFREQVLCLINTLARQVLVRRVQIDLPEDAVKMKRRQACLLRDMIQADRCRIILINVDLRGGDTLVKVVSQFHCLNVRKDRRIQDVPGGPIRL